jgi:hypothetical protein
VNYKSKVNKAETLDFRTTKDMRDERRKSIMGNKLNWRNNIRNRHPVPPQRAETGGVWAPQGLCFTYFYFLCEEGGGGGGVTFTHQFVFCTGTLLTQGNGINRCHMSLFIAPQQIVDMCTT